MQISMKETEKKVFRAAINDGLWDIFLGCFFFMFIGAIFLSPRLGDFWSSALIIPVWGLLYLVMWLIRKHVVRPRIGIVAYGRSRKAKLKKFTLVMLAINIAAFILGLVAAANIGRISGQMTSIFFGLLLLCGFNIAAYFLDFNRLYIYGLLLGLAPLVGEWLWVRSYAPHHGFPVTFGTAAGIMIIVGLTVFTRLVRANPVPTEGISSEKAQ